MPLSTHVFEQQHVRLTSSKDADDLLRAAKPRKNVVLKIDVLEVFISDATGIKPIREILTLARNITALVLKLPFKPICAFPTSLTFEHLISLNINIPHAVIASFIQRHPRLESLQLGACGNANTQTCPLTHYSIQLPFLIELICPPSCVRAVMPGSIVKTLFTTYDGVNRHKFPMYKLLNLHQIGASATLTTLLLDFDNSTPQLLYRISVAAPALRVLKLCESKFSRKVCYTVHN